MINYEKRIYSQNGEDGVIEHIFDTIGTTNLVAVEFGVSAGGGGVQTNTRNLAYKGWKTFWFDVEDASDLPPNCIFQKKFLTVNNIVNTFKEHNVPYEFDLLSIDVDGNDWHLREALKEFSPRVCILEYNGCYDSTTEYIMPYDENFRWKKGNRQFGASLSAYVKQADRLGYDLVFCESRGVNAFFIRKDINPFVKKTSEEAWVKLYWAGN